MKMTLKELRISKGLTQSECAEYLGMTSRNYQNYEYDKNKENTVKYNAIFKKLETYGNNFTHINKGYNTNVITGIELKECIKTVLEYQKRDCFDILKHFVLSPAEPRVAILYGLRRTGKTTLIFQMINELPVDKTAYIKIKSSDNMSKLTKDLDLLFGYGYRYIFIDEITLMEDFIDTAVLLSDIFACVGMKIVLSGTDSLGFAMADRDELYDRNVMIHTSFIPFREYSRLLSIQSVDTYIEYGGTLKIENMEFDDPEYKLDEVSFRDDESTRKYIDTSISRNIQNTLKNDRFGYKFNELRDLYDNRELTNVINRIVENMNHQFLLRVVEDEFKSHDFGSAKELLLHEYPLKTAHILYDIDEKAVVERLKNLIDIKEKNETKVKVSREHIEKIKKYLFMLDLIVECEECYESKGVGEHIVITQPGMRYSIAKALIYSLMQDKYFNHCSEIDKKHISEKILEDVKGRMLEDIILLETSKSARRHEKVFKFKFDDGSEYDMIVYDETSNTCRIYEIKHSEKTATAQRRYLIDKTKLELIEHRFGKIEGLYVLYRGERKTIDGIKYINVERYLNSLK